MSAAVVTNVDDNTKEHFPPTLNKSDAIVQEDSSAADKKKRKKAKRKAGKCICV